MMDVDLVKRLRFGSLTTMGAHRMNLEAADEITRLRAQLAAAEADRLAFGERVRDAAVRLIQTVEYHDRPNWASQGPWSYACEIYAMRISTLDLNALAEEVK